MLVCYCRQPPGGGLGPPFVCSHAAEIRQHATIQLVRMSPYPPCSLVAAQRRLYLPVTLSRRPEGLLGPPEGAGGLRRGLEFNVPSDMPPGTYQAGWALPCWLDPTALAGPGQAGCVEARPFGWICRGFAGYLPGTCRVLAGYFPGICRVLAGYLPGSAG